MIMQPQHTFLLHDLRPTKAAMHHALDRFERDEASTNETLAELHALAESIPDLNARDFVKHTSRLLLVRNVDRARKLVDCLGDRTIKPWARLVFGLAWFGVKWGVILGVIYLVVRLAVGS